MEIWKSLDGIVECGSKYEVSNLGRVRNTKTKRILKLQKNTCGYLQVDLCENNKRKYAIVHRLVALAFLPNPYNLKEINHKDENKENNVLSNLEWCDRKYNCNFGRHNEKLSKSLKGKNEGKNSPKSIPIIVLKIHNDGTLSYVSTFESIRQASRILDIFDTQIHYVLKGKNKQAKGYTFKYMEG